MKSVVWLKKLCFPSKNFITSSVAHTRNLITLNILRCERELSRFVADQRCDVVAVKVGRIKGLLIKRKREIEREKGCSELPLMKTLRLTIF